MTMGGQLDLMEYEFLPVRVGGLKSTNFMIREEVHLNSYPQGYVD